MQPLLAAGVIVIVCCGLYGWGVLARRWAGLPIGTWPVTLALGLACWIFLGGVLNLARAAYPAVLNTSMLVGLGFAFEHWHRTRKNSLWLVWWPRERDERIYRLVWYGLVLAIMGFTLITQLEPTIFNDHDDLQKYFAHAARMVQTGTLYGSPLNALGSESLGGQALLQAFVIGNFSIAYINAADAIFCLLLILLMAGGVAMHRPAVAPAAGVTILMVAIINPSYVSVTALYSGAALMFAIMLLSADAREYSRSPNSRSVPPSVVGLLYASLIALKPTFAIFAGLHFLCCIAASAAATRAPANQLRRALLTVVWGLAFLSPWLALYAPDYAFALMHAIPLMAQRPVPAQETVNLLSMRPLLYGGSFADYTWLAAVILLCGIAPELHRRRWSDPDAARLLGGSLAVAVGYPIMILFFGRFFAELETALRHYVPILIGTAPPALSLGALLINPPNRSHRPGRAQLAFVLLGAMTVIWFLPSAYQRARLVVNRGSMLAYLQIWSPAGVDDARSFDHFALDGFDHDKLLAVQRLVPPGEPLLAWIATPFALDFARNPIIDVDLAGLGTPWTEMPRVSYVLWKYQGYGVRRPMDYAIATKGPGWRETFIHARGYQFELYLNELLKSSEILFNDGEIVLFKTSSLPPFP